MPTPTKQRVSIYIDGFNFYYGIRDNKWKRYYWLDVVKFFETFIRPHQELVEVTYFSARPLDQGKADRQDLFFSANILNPKFSLELGRYLPKKIKCKNCKVVHNTFEEKETDVKIAVKMISDVVNNVCDVSILVSADSDLVPPIDFIRNYNPAQKILVYFPPRRFSSNLNTLATATKRLDGSGKIFASCQLPPTVTAANGYVIVKPPSWV